MANSWRSNPQFVPYATNRVWGTGVNPVHAVNDRTGRNIAPDAIKQSVPSQLVCDDDNYANNDDFGGYTLEDTQTQIWGYGIQTGTAERPNWGDESGSRHTTTTDNQSFPDWGRRRSKSGQRTGIPGGTFFRSLMRGQKATNTAKTDYRVSQFAGGENKVSAAKENVANDSDPSQIFMQTSETQRTKSRSGSQRSGSQSDYDATIESRIVGPQKFIPSGSYRHEEMLPREQSPNAVRPFRVRTAGVGPVAWMEPNQDTDNVPRNRIPPDRPYAGEDVTGNPDGYISGNHVYGFTDEDVVY